MKWQRLTVYSRKNTVIFFIFQAIIVVEDYYYYPQIVPIVLTVKVVKRHHCVPIPKHIYEIVIIQSKKQSIST